MQTFPLITYVFLYATADAAYLVMFPLYWAGWSAFCMLCCSLRDSGWVQVKCCSECSCSWTYDSSEGCAGGQKTNNSTKTEKCVYKGGVRSPSGWSDVQTSDVSLWFCPPGCWLWPAQQWRSVTPSQGSDLHPLVLPIWKTWHQCLSYWEPLPTLNNRWRF